MKMWGEVGREKDEAHIYTVKSRRPARLHVDSVGFGELFAFLGSEIEQPQFNRIMIVLRINHPLTVGGNIGLVVISRTARQLLSSCRPEALPPKRALHGKDDALRICHPHHGP